MFSSLHEPWWPQIHTQQDRLGLGRQNQGTSVVSLPASCAAVGARVSLSAKWRRESILQARSRVTTVSAFYGKSAGLNYPAADFGQDSCRPLTAAPPVGNTPFLNDSNCTQPQGWFGAHFLQKACSPRQPSASFHGSRPSVWPCRVNGCSRAQPPAP